jgi:hypothetical protein
MLILSLSHTLSLILPLSYSLSLSHTHSLMLSFSYSLSHSPSFTLSLSSAVSHALLSYTLSHTHSLMHSLAYTLSHTLSRIHTLSLTHSRLQVVLQKFEAKPWFIKRFIYFAMRSTTGALRAGSRRNPIFDALVFSQVRGACKVVPWR